MAPSATASSFGRSASRRAASSSASARDGSGSEDAAEARREACDARAAEAAAAEEARERRTTCDEAVGADSEGAEARERGHRVARTAVPSRAAPRRRDIAAAEARARVWAGDEAIARRVGGDGRGTTKYR